MYSDHDHGRISFTCAYWLVNTIFFFRQMVLASWPGGMTMTISFTCVYLLIWHDRGLPETRWRWRSDLVGHPRRIRRWPDLLQWDPPVWRTASMMLYCYEGSELTVFVVRFRQRAAVIFGWSTNCDVIFTVWAISRHIYYVYKLLSVNCG